MYNHPNPAVYLWRNIEINAVKNLIKDYKFPDIVYDLGCGDKTISKYLFPNKQIIGIDIKGNPDIKADIYNLPFKNKPVDFMFCNSVLEHLTDINLALYNIGKSLKKRGIFIFTVPVDNLNSNLPRYFRGIINKAIKHRYFLNYSEWKKYLWYHDIAIIKSIYYLDKHSTKHWLKMLILQKLFGTLFLNRQKLDKLIGEDNNGCSGSCIAFLCSKI